MIDNREIVLELLLPSHRNPVHVCSLDEIVVGLLVLRNPHVVDIALLCSGLGRIFVDRSLESGSESRNFTLERLGIPLLLLAVYFHSSIAAVVWIPTSEPTHGVLIAFLSSGEGFFGHAIGHTSRGPLSNHDQMDSDKWVVMFEIRLTGGAKLAESSSITPSDRFGSGAELNSGYSWHLIAEHGLFELDTSGRLGDPLSFSVKAANKFLEGMTGVSIQPI